MSPQKDQDYFCEGIAEELINALDRTSRACASRRGPPRSSSRAAPTTCAGSDSSSASRACSKAACARPATGCASRPSSSTRATATTSGPSATTATWRTSSRSRTRSRPPSSGRSRFTWSGRAPCPRPAVDGERRGLQPLPAGPLLVEQAHRGRAVEGHRVLRAGDREGPVLRAGARRPRRLLQRDRLLRARCRRRSPSRRRARPRRRRSRSTPAWPRPTSRWRWSCSGSTGTGRARSASSARPSRAIRATCGRTCSSDSCSPSWAASPRPRGSGRRRSSSSRSRRSRTASSARGLYFARRYEEGLERCRKALEIDPNHLQGLWAGAGSAAHIPLVEEALDKAERAATLAGRAPMILTNLAAALTAAGRHEDTRALLAELEARASTGVRRAPGARLDLGLPGRQARRARRLERGYEERNSMMLTIGVAAEFDFLRAEPRFVGAAPEDEPDGPATFRSPRPLARGRGCSSRRRPCAPSASAGSPSSWPCTSRERGLSVGRDRRGLHGHDGRGRALDDAARGRGEPRRSRAGHARDGAADRAWAACSWRSRSRAGCCSPGPCSGRSARTARRPVRSRRWSRPCFPARSESGSRTRLFGWYNVFGFLPGGARGARRRVVARSRAGAGSRRARRVSLDALGLRRRRRRADAASTSAWPPCRRPSRRRRAQARRSPRAPSLARASCSSSPACRPSTRWPGGFIIQSLLAYWFHLRFGVGPEALGALFFGTNLLSALSFLLATRIAERVGLLNTMVFTHLPSNVLLLLVPFMPTFTARRRRPAPAARAVPDGRADTPGLHDGPRRAGGASRGRRPHRQRARPGPGLRPVRLRRDHGGRRDAARPSS